jgi:uncharacterized protein (DUF433 family)
MIAMIDRTGDEPVIKGTAINAYRIAALHDGMTVEEILRDYRFVRPKPIQTPVGSTR